MKPSRRLFVLVTIAFLLLAPPLSALASPSTAPLCSQPEYRQAHLRECNLGGNPGFGVGAGGGSGGGLLGLIGDVLGGIGL